MSAQPVSWEGAADRHLPLVSPETGPVTSDERCGGHQFGRALPSPVPFVFDNA